MLSVRKLHAPPENLLGQACSRFSHKLDKNLDSLSVWSIAK